MLQLSFDNLKLKVVYDIIIVSPILSDVMLIILDDTTQPFLYFKHFCLQYFEVFEKSKNFL